MDTGGRCGLITKLILLLVIHSKNKDNINFFTKIRFYLQKIAKWAVGTFFSIERGYSTLYSLFVLQYSLVYIEQLYCSLY